ncbi:DUF4435 domain-containing protein [Aeromonas veronii]|uniref:DUF4435 domain-containing protein n=1 Tax=Aeromonas veronii TaxID=654 RepID=UPI003B9F1D27
MPNFSYSTDAESVKNLFYNADAIVYVEGQDDIPFWELMFKKFSQLNVEIQDVGSCSALKPYMEKICNENLKAIVACDKDLTFLDDENLVHHNIIRTYGYSIENTLLNSDNLLKTIKVLGRIPSGRLAGDDISSWLEHFYTHTATIIKMDVFNAKHKLGISIVGDNATRFMESRNSYQICPKKIARYIESITPQIPGYSENIVDGILDEAGVNTHMATKGHFLFSAAAHYLCLFIKKQGLKVSLSYDAIYSALVLSLESTFSEGHVEFHHYNESFQRINI